MRSKIIKKYWKTYYFVKINVFEHDEVSRDDLGRSWAKMRPTWAPEGPQDGAQKGAKTEQKKRRKSEEKRVRARGSKKMGRKRPWFLQGRQWREGEIQGLHRRPT